MGRPSTFSQEIADQILERIASGDSLRSICDGEGMPGTTTVCRWLNTEDGFREQYARARARQGEVYGERVAEISEDMWANKRSYDAETTQAARAAMDGFKWTAARLAPKVYGDKTQVEAEVKHEVVRRRVVIPKVARLDADAD